MRPIKYSAGRLLLCGIVISKELRVKGESFSKCFSISINKCFQTISIKCTLIVSYDNHFLLRYIYTWKVPAAAKAFLDMVTDKHQIINLPYNTDDKLGGGGRKQKQL